MTGPSGRGWVPSSLPTRGNLSMNIQQETDTHVPFDSYSPSQSTRVTLTTNNHMPGASVPNTELLRGSLRGCRGAGPLWSRREACPDPPRPPASPHSAPGVHPPPSSVTSSAGRLLPGATCPPSRRPKPPRRLTINGLTNPPPRRPGSSPSRPRPEWSATRPCLPPRAGLTRT